MNLPPQMLLWVVAAGSASCPLTGSANLVNKVGPHSLLQEVLGAHSPPGSYDALMTVNGSSTTPHFFVSTKESPSSSAPACPAPLGCEDANLKVNIQGSYTYSIEVLASEEDTLSLGKQLPG